MLKIHHWKAYHREIYRKFEKNDWIRVKGRQDYESWQRLRHQLFKRQRNVDKAWRLIERAERKKNVNEQKNKRKEKTTIRFLRCAEKAKIH